MFTCNTNSNRCLNGRMRLQGGNIRWARGSGFLGHRYVNEELKFSRDVRSLSVVDVFVAKYNKQDGSNIVRQYHNSCIHMLSREPQWGVDKHCVQNLDTSNQKQCINHCTLLRREVKYTGRRSFEATEPTRVGTEPKPVPLLRHSLGTSHYKSFRNAQHNQMQTLQQSVSRPRLLWGERPSPVRLGARNELCQRPAEASRQCVKYNIVPRGRSYDYCSSVESEKLVPKTKKVIHCQSNQTTTRSDVLYSKGPSTPGGAKKPQMGMVCSENLWAKALGTELWPPECIKNVHSFLPLPRWRSIIKALKSLNYSVKTVGVTFLRVQII